MTDSNDLRRVPDWDVLDRYYAGEATRLEHDHVDQYFAAHPAGRSVLEALAHVVRRQAAPAMANGVRAMLSAAHQRLAKTVIPQGSVRRPEYGRLEHAIAALLDVEDAELTAAQVDELRRLIESAREEGR